ncbi:MAG: Exodeoxyribonuclease [Chroococcidiopsis cubana SAG 39.79]|jgi:exodeoxyribonuclease III|uniref:Exodeoxyribonuclease III n=2 Tax=Chroococcidiopsis TaxID=54298 RepID=K9TXW5_CHRTP|nr:MULTISPECIES: exodeoxyribonuclease III [Chroococcidiopsis]PSB40905.1 exodeoxyribonuclease III [Cyanosarcina cf. burmensis CCALA 770]AFY87405.1 Exodeoxyribonuclease III [Chroococcidiopsis thermalis PCC 7203]MDZ4875119.1 Exodeoxyribonuclease [Chroococcidiopsis cubana SAG 39.79]PSB61297.1 exodeoxyribonuclease III [Chroococcidiopsis cubana CCALA 043]RUT09396.1 exodeoxyribonuclease III [Chroococcidiopsis cubana SAG 39.79]
MKIATWNVNSVRTRLEQVIDWLRQTPVDVLCLQETKVVDADFPRSPFEHLGYYVYASGQKSYNGVAILSQQPLQDVSTGFAPLLVESGIVEAELLAALDEQKRVIAGTLDRVRIVNLYVPNGAAVGSEKYEYKLGWLKVLREYLRSQLLVSPVMCVCGDFNIAPDERDLHDPDKLTGQIMASELERQALQEILALGFADAFRKFITEGGHYSWWDYRTAAFRRNLGWRIDHLYLSPQLYQQAIACWIDPAPRKLPKPSDHTPVVVEF